MTARPEEEPGYAQPNENPGANPGLPSLPPALQAATPLLLSTKISTVDTALVLSEAEAKGAHVVRRKLASVTDEHYYKVVHDKLGDFSFRSFFAQPSTVAQEALLVNAVVLVADGNLAVLPNTGSSVAHGDFGPNNFHVSNNTPTYYFVISPIAGNMLPDKPYTFLVAEV